MARGGGIAAAVGALAALALPAGAHAADPAVSVTGPAEAFTSQRVTFAAEATADGPPPALEWDLDDDGAFDDASGTAASRSFPKAGTAAVAVRATDFRGATAVATAAVKVVARPPMAAFTIDRAAPQAGELVTFTSTEADTVYVLAALDWDLDGDGAFDDARGVQASSAYAPGVHVVRLRVRDMGGVTAIAERSFEVGGPPAKDTRSPLLFVSAPKNRPLRPRHGIKLRVSVDETAGVRLKLTVSRRTARRTGLARRAKGPVVIGRFDKLLPAGERLVTVKLTRRARSKLARVRRLKVKVHGRAVDTAGLETELVAPVKLAR
jgi:hypothetical protein